MQAKLNTKKNVALTIASALLLLALFDGWQYGFFTILRFVVFGSTAYVAFLAYQEEKESWAWFLGGVAVLFNPFVPVYFTRDIWLIVDFITAVMLVVSVFVLKFAHKNEAGGK